MELSIIIIEVQLPGEEFECKIEESNIMGSGTFMTTFPTVRVHSDCSETPAGFKHNLDLPWSRYLNHVYFFLGQIII